jgi:hypothetical protein
VGEKFDVDRGRFLEDLTSYEVVAEGFFGVEMVDGSLDICSGEARDRRV